MRTNDDTMITIKVMVFYVITDILQMVSSVLSTCILIHSFSFSVYVCFCAGGLVCTGIHTCVCL